MTRCHTISLYNSLSRYLAISLSRCLAVSLSRYLTITLSRYLAICTSVLLSVFLSLCTSLYVLLYFSLCTSVCILLCLCFALFILQEGSPSAFSLPTPVPRTNPDARPLGLFPLHTHTHTQTHTHALTRRYRTAFRPPHPHYKDCHYHHLATV